MVKELPRSVQWIRILLFVIAALTFVTAIALFIAADGSAYAFGYVLGLSLPGVVQLVLGLVVPKGGRGVFYAILVTEMLLALVTLVSLVRDGLVTQLIFPVAILVLLSRPSARGFFLDR